MPRQVRVQYEDAIYHVMAHGNRLDWIAKELHMGVRNGVKRAEQMLKTKLKHNKQVQRMWRKMEKMHHFYA